MKEVKLKDCLTDEEVDLLRGKFLNESNYNMLIQEEDTKVIKPDGDILLIFKKKVLSSSVCKNAYPILRKAARISNNRGMAAGEVDINNPEQIRKLGKRFLVRGFKLSSSSPLRFHPMKKDGTISNTNYAVPVESGVIGYFDRNPRFPYCRLSAFDLENPSKVKEAMPFFQEINKVFAVESPERYKAQMEMVKKTSKDFVLNNTCFTTVTINRNWQTAVHKDAGDLKEGFGVMSALSAGNYKGCYLCFPKYKVAVDMRTRDVLLAQVHDWHGNTPFIGIKDNYERISTVLYYREKIKHCGTAEEELERAQNRKSGDKING